MARKGEGYIEYVVVLSLITVCSVSVLAGSYSTTIRRIAGARQLCAMQDDGPSVTPAGPPSAAVPVVNGG